MKKRKTKPIKIKKNKKRKVAYKTKPRKPTAKKPYKRLTREEYAKALQHPKWQKKRLKVFERDKWRCRKCKDEQTTLHVHHLEYTRRYPYNEPIKNLITYCSDCHKKVHKK